MNSVTFVKWPSCFFDTSVFRGPVVMFGGQFLPGRRVQKLQVGLRGGAVPVFVDVLVDDRHRRFSEDADARRDDLVFVLPHLLGQVIGLVLPGDEDVADPALRERDRRPTGAGVEHRYVLVQLADEVFDLVLVPAELLFSPGPGGQVVPARAAGGLRVRCDDRDARLGQIAPVLDALWVSFANHEDDRGRVRRGIVGQPLLPGCGEPAQFLGDRVDVAGQRQRHHVGLQAVDDGAGLLARSTV